MDSGSRPRYLVTGDMNLLVRRWAQSKGFIPPDRHFFGELMRSLVTELKRIFEPCGIDVEFISWADMRQRLTTLIDMHSSDKSPIISLDPVYVEDADMHFSTNRLVHYSKHTHAWSELGKGPRPGSPMIEVQLANIAKHGSLVRSKRVIVVDDGVWTGGTLAALDELFLAQRIKVNRFLVALQIRQREPSKALLAIEDRIIAHRDGNFPAGAVHDWLCERDFYVGVPYSGKTLGVEIATNGDAGVQTPIQRHYPNQPMHGNFGAPYIAPLGDPEHWAKIPASEVVAFSRFCLLQSRKLYERIEKETARVRGHHSPILVKQLARPPFFYVKPDWSVLKEIDISLSKLA